MWSPFSASAACKILALPPVSSAADLIPTVFVSDGFSITWSISPILANSAIVRCFDFRSRNLWPHNPQRSRCAASAPAIQLAKERVSLPTRTHILSRSQLIRLTTAAGFFRTTPPSRNRTAVSPLQSRHVAKWLSGVSAWSHSAERCWPSPPLLSPNTRILADIDPVRSQDVAHSMITPGRILVRYQQRRQLARRLHRRAVNGAHRVPARRRWMNR